MRISRFKPFSALLVPLVFFLLAAPTPASAVPLTQIGIRYFERGHLAYLRDDMDAAARYFARSADAFLQYRDEGGSLFESNTLQAGIGLYYSGDYDRCIQVMEPLADDPDLWEADIYGALAYARKGDAAKAAGLLAKFPETARQHILSAAVHEAEDGLRSGSMTPADAAALVASQIRRQLIFNIYASTPDAATAPEQCDGRFWWRYSNQRCMTNQKFDPFDD